ncbi:PAS domain S-box protein [Rubellimicrobium roseum]|nr:PAS domain S-box protein [Rubellimicrobium roseum]
MLDALPLLGFIADADGATLYANKHCQAYTGRSADTLLGFHWSSLIHPEDRERTAAAWHAAQAFGEPVEMEYRLRRADGADRWFQGPAAPQRDERGTIRYWLGILSDIHDLKTAEKAARTADAKVRDAEEWRRLAQEASGVGTFDWNPITQELRWSAECRAVFGVPSEVEITDDLFLSCLHPEDRLRVIERIERALDPAGTGEYRSQHRALWPNGTVRWVEARGRVTFAEVAGLQRAVRFMGTVLDITEMKAADDAVVRQQQELQALADAMPVLIAYIDAERRYQFANKIYETWFPRRREDILGRPVREIVGEAAFASVAHHMDAALQGERVTFEQVMPYTTTAPRHVEVEYIPRKSPDGRIEGFYTLVQDVTAEKAAEAALREAEAVQRTQAEELLAVLNAVPAGIWITHDPEALEIIGNARSHEFLRVPQDANSSKSAPGTPTSHFRFLDADGRELLPRDLPVQTAARGQPVTDREYRVAFDDGSHIDLFGNATPLLDDQGQPAGAVAAFMDITARKAAEAALREESHILETLNRAGMAMAGELDLERLVQSFTDAGVELTGARFGAFFHNILDQGNEQFLLYTLSGAQHADFEGLGGVRITGLFGPTFRNEGVVRSDDVLVDPRYGQMAPHHGMPPGHLPVRSYLGVPVVSRSGEVLGGLLFGHPEPQRFTERHERLMVGLAAQAAIAIDNARLFQAVQQANETLETRVAERTAELVQTQEALQQSQKMEAIGQLTGGIAHDFNNLLTPIVGGLDVLRRRVADERSQRLIEGALQSAERATTLVQRLLAFARRQTLQPRAVSLADLIGGMRELIGRSLGPTIEVSVDVPVGFAPVLVDPNQLELALLNLSVNARDAMPDGGQLRIWAEAHEAASCSVPGLTPGHYVRLSVSDTGTGMDAATLARAVEPFFSTKGLGKGTGLGLSMVHGMAAQSGGLFNLSSQVGQGTTAELWLPTADAPAQSQATQEAALPKSQRAVILLVDDEDLVRQSTAEGLRDLGYEVVAVDNAAAALETIQGGLQPDAVVTDHMMPGLSGAQLAAQLQERMPELPVLMITGYASLTPEQMQGLTVLSKPFRLADLVTLLGRLCAQGDLLADTLSRGPAQSYKT